MVMYGSLVEMKCENRTDTSRQVLHLYPMESITKHRWGVQAASQDACSTLWGLAESVPVRHIS